jgi:hypothetical protein
MARYVMILRGATSLRGPTLSNAPGNDVVPLKINTYHAIKTTGTLVVLCNRVLLCSDVVCCCVCCVLLCVVVCCGVLLCVVVCCVKEGSLASSHLIGWRRGLVG